MNRLAIMQPYVFPYIGYFQLLNAVDKFVFYDDVNFINRGWIARNRILIGGKEAMFSLPLNNKSQFKLICETEVHSKQYSIWKKKFYNTITQSYSKAPYFKEVFALITSVFDKPTHYISEIAINSIIEVCNFLTIKTKFSRSSIDFQNRNLQSTERIIDIISIENSSEYINPINGEHLYSKEMFAKHRIKLYFIKTENITYTQHKDSFVPFLSIIDVLMFNGRKTKEFLIDYTLI